MPKMRGLGSLELKNLTEDIRETMWPIETGEQRVHAPDLHFLEQECLICRPLVTPRRQVRQSVGKVGGELVKGEALGLDAALASRH
jgi:hypothetical protein